MIALLLIALAGDKPLPMREVYEYVEVITARFEDGRPDLVVAYWRNPMIETEGGSETTNHVALKEIVHVGGRYYCDGLHAERLRFGRWSLFIPLKGFDQMRGAIPPK
jgi:hypothetical protein